VYHLKAGDTVAVMDFEMALLDSPAVRANRKQALLDETSWRKSRGLINIFSQFTPLETKQVTRLEVILGIADGEQAEDLNDAVDGAGWLGWCSVDHPGSKVIKDTLEARCSGVDEWLILGFVGGPTCRDIALKDPFRVLLLPPVASLAVRLNQGTKPSPSALFCGGSYMGDSGLPFHCDAPFLEVILIK